MTRVGLGGGGGVRLAMWHSRGLGHVTWQSDLIRGRLGTQTRPEGTLGEQSWGGFAGAELVRLVLLPRLEQNAGIT